MKVLIFEPFSGASGDMIISSLLDLGVDESKIADSIAAFNIGIEVAEVEKRGIVAKSIRFIGDAGERSYTELVRLIKDSGLDNDIIKNALSILERIADAESKIHGTEKQRLKFHELGAIDTIGDLVGSCVAFAAINPDTVMSTPIAVGMGYVETEHGILPVPAPATMEILRETSLLIQGGPAHAELLTPTGAAILAHFVQRAVNSLPAMRITATGYGAGSAELPIPNVLRVSLGELDTVTGFATDMVGVLETNVDDVTGEVVGNLVEVLMAEGARDVTVLPALMKKGRFGHVIRVITSAEDIQRMAHIIMKETGTLGVRVMHVQRHIATREKREINLRIKGVERKVSVKIGRDAGGEILNIAAEFEDAKRIAGELKLPLKEVIRMVECEARKNLFLFNAY